MRRVQRWIMVMLITAIGIIAGWTWQGHSPLPQVVDANFRPEVMSSLTSPAPQRQPDLTALPTLAVDGDRILADVRALETERFTAEERERARTYILNALEATGWQTQLQPFEGGVNIVAKRPGDSATAERLLVGGHYDSVEGSPGADDNATAIAALLELARVFKDVSTARSLQLAFFDLEEAGLLGSTEFVKQAANVENLQGAVILEMLGYACHTEGCQRYPSVLPISPPTTKGDFIAAIADQGHPELLEAFIASAKPGTPPPLTLAVPLLGPLTPDLLRSDHAPFWSRGIGAVMVTDTANFRNPNYHQPSDTVESLDADFLVGTVELTANAVLRLLHS